MYHVYSSFDDPTMDRSSEAVPRYLISNATLIFSLRNRRSLATRTTTFRCPQRRLTVRQTHRNVYTSYCENRRGRRFDRLVSSDLRSADD